MLLVSCTLLTQAGGTAFNNEFTVFKSFRYKIGMAQSGQAVLRL
jgi:hypothetical protein